MRQLSEVVVWDGTRLEIMMKVKGNVGFHWICMVTVWMISGYLLIHVPNCIIIYILYIFNWILLLLWQCYCSMSNKVEIYITVDWRNRCFRLVDVGNKRTKSKFILVFSVKLNELNKPITWYCDVCKLEFFSNDWWFFKRNKLHYNESTQMIAYSC